MILTKKGVVSFKGKQAFIVYNLLQGKKMSSKECYSLNGVRLFNVLRKLTKSGIVVNKQRNLQSNTNGRSYKYFLSKGIEK